MKPLFTVTVENRLPFSPTELKVTWKYRSGNGYNPADITVIIPNNAGPYDAEVVAYLKRDFQEISNHFKPQKRSEAKRVHTYRATIGWESESWELSNIKYLIVEGWINTTLHYKKQLKAKTLTQT